MPYPIKPPANGLYDQSKWNNEPAGPKIAHGYRRWHVPVGYSVEELAEMVKFTDGTKMDLETLVDFNFDTEKLPGSRRGYGTWYLLTYAGFTQEKDVVWNSGQSTAWLWVPGNAVIPGDLGQLEDLQTKKPPPPRPVTRPGADTHRGARSQQQGPKAVTTIVQKYLPGDVLLAEHEEDELIQQMTLTWPTHAGICVGKDEAVDADGGRGKSDAVANVGIEDEFFDEGETPGGGLVLRYAGSSGPKENEKIGRAAANWARQQVGREYHFTLKSPILGEQRGVLKDIRVSFQVPDKRFKDGKGIDSEGKPLTMPDNKKKGATKEKFHEIYCAELVWRAYRFGANVTLVDPKKFFCMYDHPKRAVVVLLSEWAEDEDREKLTEALSKKPVSGLTKSPSVARWLVTTILRWLHSGYLCAPHQFLESKKLKQVQVIRPERGFKKHKVYNYDGVDIHPLKLLELLGSCPKDDKGQKRKKGQKGHADDKDQKAHKAHKDYKLKDKWEEWRAANVQTGYTSVYDPLHLQSKS